GLFQPKDLIDGCLNVAGVGVAHGLHANRRIPTHCDAADRDLTRLPPLNQAHVVSSSVSSVSCPAMFSAAASQAAVVAMSVGALSLGGAVPCCSSQATTASMSLSRVDAPAVTPTTSTPS